jgi:cell wall assembly regulator SMI1
MSETRKAAGLTWKRCEPPADDAAIKQVEQSIGVRFPSDFLEVMRVCQGGTPIERMRFDYQHPRIGSVGSGLGILLNFIPGDSSNILEVMKDLSYDAQLPEKVIPFADDGGGDMMCLDYRDDPGYPKVVYWAHEESKDESIFPLARSFTEFLDMLEPYEGP